MAGSADANLLIVEDNPSGLAALESILSGPGLRLHRAACGKQAMKLLLTGPPLAVILLDVQLPDFDGFEVARLIRTLDAYRHVPIIFLTAYHKSDEHLLRGYSLGAVDYLFKPINPEILRAKVAAFVDLHRRTEEVREQAESLREFDRRQYAEDLAEARARIAAESEKAREELLRRERQLEQERVRLFTLSADLLCIAGLDGRIRQPNPAFHRTLGYDHEDLIGRPVADIVHPDDRTAVQDALKRLEQGTDPAAFECRCVGKDGGIRWVSWTAAGFAREGLLYAIGRDVTERRQVARDLEDMVADLRNLHEVSTRLARSVEMAPVLREVLRTVMELQGADLGVVSLYEPASEELVPVATLGRDEDAAELRERRVRLGAGFAGRAVAERREVFVPDLQEAPHDVAGSARRHGYRAVQSIPLFNGQQDILGAIESYFRKPRVLERRERHLVDLYINFASQFVDNARLYREAQQAVRAREEFLSVASHELKTPLTALRLHLQSVLRRSRRDPAPDPASVLLSVQDAERQGEALTRLITSLLDLSRIRAGKLKLDREPVDLARSVGEVLDRFREELDSRGIAVDVRLGAPAAGTWDRMRVEQIVTNLISNAIKYGEGRPIDVSVEARDGRARLVVRDHGCGISRDFMGRLFLPFERDVSGAQGGLGLGLYIVRQVVAAHDGDIRVESRVGEGTTFTVELPLDGLAAGSKERVENAASEGQPAAESGP